MTRHPTSSRVHRETEPDDAFIARILELTAWGKGNSRLLVIGATVLAVLIAGGAYYLNYQRTIRTQAAIEIMNVRQVAATGNNALAVRDLQGFLNRFDGTPSADEARVLLGQVHLQAGDVEQAVAVLEPLARNPSRSNGAAAAFLLAAAHEHAEAYDAAESVYLSVSERAELTFQRRDALDAAARLRLERGDAAGAASLYRQLIEDMPESDPDRAIYEMRMAEAEARASYGQEG